MVATLVAQNTPGNPDGCRFCLRFLATVPATRLSSLVDSQSILSTPNDLISNTRQIANPPASDQDDRVFLQIVTFARNINSDFLAIAQANTGDLPQGRVRLFRSHRSNLQANTLLLRALFQHWRFGELSLGPTILANQLINCWHKSVVLRSFTGTGVGLEPTGISTT